MTKSGVDILVARQDLTDQLLRDALSTATRAPPERIAVIRDIADYPPVEDADVVCNVFLALGRFSTVLSLDGFVLDPGDDVLSLVGRLSSALRAICLIGTSDSNPYAMYMIEAGQPHRRVFLVVDAADEGRYDIDEELTDSMPP